LLVCMPGPVGASPKPEARRVTSYGPKTTWERPSWSSAATFSSRAVSLAAQAGPNTRADAITFGMISVIDESAKFGLVPVPTVAKTPWGPAASLASDASIASAEGAFTRSAFADDGSDFSIGGLMLSHAEEQESPAIPLEKVATVGGGDGCTDGVGEPCGVGPGRVAGAHLASTGITVAGHSSRDAVQRVVRSQLGRFRTCVEPALSKNPSLRGRVVVKFTIGEDCLVMTARDGGSDLADETATACITRSFMNLTFPPSGGTVSVVYPLLIGPTEVSDVR